MDASAVLLRTLAVALASGVAAQVLAERLAVPAIVPLLIAGTLLGPDGLGWVEPRALGDGLEALVAFSAAVVLFEGGLRLDWKELLHQRRLVLQLVSAGALVTMAGAAAAAWLVLDLEPRLALLLGSVVTVTGPTVIGPLLRRVRIARRVAFVLESEAVLAEPVGAILAFVVLELVLAGDLPVSHGPASLAVRLATGIAVGAGAGAFLAAALRRRWISDPELGNLLALTTAVGSFLVANAVRSESGLVAAVAAGTVVGNLSVPGLREIVAFKGLVSTLVISLLFVLLSADIRWSLLAEVGARGVVWALLLMVAVRPLCVFVSTVGTATPLADKLLLSWISPRGIVAASVAALFAGSLRREGIAEGETLQALVFVAIALTVLVQGLTARRLAEILGLAERAFGVVIVGANATGRLLGRLLAAHGREVSLIDSNPRNADRARREGLAARTGNCLDRETLDASGIRAADALVAVTANSDVNTLVARLAIEAFRVPRALVLAAHGDKLLDAATREIHRIERAFCGAVPADLDERLSRGDGLWIARVGRGAPRTVAGAGEGELGIPLVRFRGERAEPCGENSPLAPGDRLIGWGTPRAPWLEEPAPYPADRLPAAGEVSLEPGACAAGADVRQDDPGSPASAIREFVRLWFAPETVRRGLGVAAVVGPVLIAINHADALLAFDLSPKLLLKMFLTFLVPYAVSSYSSARAAMRSGRTPPDPPGARRDGR